MYYIYACTQGTMLPGFFGNIYIPQSKVKLILAIITYHLQLCLTSIHAYVDSVSVCACMHMCMCLHVSNMCSAGPEGAVLDCYGPEADPVYWQRGRTLGSV